MNKNKGFTLTEIVVVISIIGILAMALVPKIMSISDKANDKGVLTQFKAIEENMRFHLLTKAELPNIESFFDLVSEDYIFSIDTVMINKENDNYFLAIRTVSDFLTTYNEPLGMSYIIYYDKVNNDFLNPYYQVGTEPNTFVVNDIEGCEDLLMNIPSKDIEAIVLDCLRSNVPEIVFYK